jgi:uncharacterized membrane protein
VRHEVSIDIDAPPSRVWQVMSDVERWPEWTRSVDSVTRIDDGPLRLGSKARIDQPKVPPIVWEVTELEAGSHFIWEAQSPALTSKATHRVEQIEGGSRATLSVEQTGLGTVLLGWWLRRINEKYLRMEVEGLKARSEAAEAGKRQADW